MVSQIDLKTPKRFTQSRSVNPCHELLHPDAICIDKILKSKGVPLSVLQREPDSSQQGRRANDLMIRSATLRRLQITAEFEAAD